MWCNREQDVDWARWILHIISFQVLLPHFPHETNEWCKQFSFSIIQRSIISIILQILQAGDYLLDAFSTASLPNSRFTVAVSFFFVHYICQFTWRPRLGPRWRQTGDEYLLDSRYHVNNVTVVALSCCVRHIEMIWSYFNIIIIITFNWNRSTRLWLALVICCITTSIAQVEQQTIHHGITIRVVCVLCVTPNMLHNLQKPVHILPVLYTKADPEVFSFYKWRRDRHVSIEWQSKVLQQWNIGNELLYNHKWS